MIIKASGKKQLVTIVCEGEEAVLIKDALAIIEPDEERDAIQAEDAELAIERAVIRLGQAKNYYEKV